MAIDGGTAVHGGVKSILPRGSSAISPEKSLRGIGSASTKYRGVVTPKRVVFAEETPPSPASDALNSPP